MVEEADDLAARVAVLVAEAMERERAAIRSQERAALIAEAQADAAEAEAAERDELIARAFERLPAAIDAAAVVEAEREAVVRAAFDGLARAFEAALALEVEAHATRSLRVAMFDGEGVFVGSMEARADMIDLHASDDYSRIVWRDEWDALRPVWVEGSRPPRYVLPIPNLAELGVTPEEIARPFAAYPLPA